MKVWTQDDVELFIVGKPPRLRLGARPKPGLFPCGEPGCNKGQRIETRGGYDYAVSCDCAGIDRLARRLDAIRLPVSAMDAVLSKWRPNGDRPSAEALGAWIDAFELRCSGRVFYGSNGPGKSWLAATAARGVATRGFSVRWVKWSELLDDLKANMKSEEPEHVVTAPLLTCDLLVVDDLGQGQGTEWAFAAYERILGARLEDGSTTLITTNAPDADALRDLVGDRVWSRVNGACVRVPVKGEDLRPQYRGRP